MTATSKEVITFLKASHDEFQVLAKEIKFDGSDSHHRCCMALYGSILELTTSCVILIDKGLLTGAFVLLRSILEAYVDLENLIESKSYLADLEMSFVTEWLRILDEAAAGGNEYLADISKSPDLAATIKKWRAKRSELEAQGGCVMTQAEKFKRAGLDREYRSIYNELCSNSHNNLRALLDRHVEEEQDDFSIVYYKEPSGRDIAINVGVLTELLMRATQATHGYFKSPVIDKVNFRRQELDKLRGE